MLNVDLSPYAGKRVCVALSGGADSVALFFLFADNAEKLHISLSAVNVEHGIRGEESEEDTAFVKNLCERAGVPLFAYAANIPALARRNGRGVEEEARAFRKEAFANLIREGKADFVATAHHAGDNAESVLFNLFRGASLTGAGGIRAFVPVEGDRGIVRPLLSCTKEEICAFLAGRGEAWREDRSNADIAYTRNYLRREVLVPAKERFADCEKNLYAFSRMAREDDDFLYSLTEKYVREGREYVIEPGAPPPVLRRCCVRAFRRFGIEKDYTLAHIGAVCRLFRQESGAEADLPKGVKAVNDYGRVAVYKPEPPPAYCYPFGEGVFDCGRYILRIAKETAPAPFGSTSKRLYFDGGGLPQNAVIRPRAEGDVFKKFGGGSKKLKEFFIDEKIPARDRDFYPLVAAGKEIFAVCGLEISDKVRVTERSGAVFSVTLCERGEERCIKT